MSPFRFKTIKLFGPPGTGKTTTLLNRIEKYIERGVSPHKIAYFSFTKKAINEGVERARSKFPNLQDQDLHNFRTIHSFCRQQFSTIPVLDEDVDIKEFNTSMGIISLDFDDTYDGHRVRKNWALRIYDKARNMMEDPISVYRREKVKRIGYDKFVNIIRLYEEFKARHRVDFTDMLKQFIEEGVAPSFDLMIIDEAQDLTPLQWKFVYKLGEKAKRIYLAGDDDQAIYEWNGADVKSFQNFPGKDVVLKYSHRLNKDIFTFCKLLQNKIRNKKEKEFVPFNKNKGNILMFKNFSELPFSLFTGKWFLLARVRDAVKVLEGEARKQGLYFQNQKGKKSFDINQWNAVRYWEDLMGGGTLTKDKVEIMYNFIEEITHGYRKIESKAWLDIDPAYEMTFETLQVVGGLSTKKKKEPWWDALNRKFNDRQKRYFLQVQKMGIDLTTKANIIIDTIHQVKGGEAENVVLFAQTNYPTNFDEKITDDKSNELRVWYTGASRSKKNLFLLGTTHRYSFPLARIYNSYLEAADAL